MFFSALLFDAVTLARRRRSCRFRRRQLALRASASPVRSCHYPRREDSTRTLQRPSRRREAVLRDSPQGAQSRHAARRPPRPFRQRPERELVRRRRFAERILRWERQGTRVILRSPTYEITADSTLPVYQAVSNSNYPPIIAVFNIETFGPDSAAVIDVTRLYTSSLPEFSGNRESIDDRRSFVERRCISGQRRD